MDPYHPVKVLSGCWLGVMGKQMLLIDGHVHIYNQFELNAFFASGFLNFSKVAKLLALSNYTPIMFVVDRFRVGGFQRLLKIAMAEDSEGREFMVDSTSETISLEVKHQNFPMLYVIAGRKIITSEGLEVLALCSSTDYPDDMPLIDTVRLVDEDKAVPVVPWAAGKWLGKRGRVVDTLLANPVDSLYLSDNGNRPGFWKWPAHFRKAEDRDVRIISGSDPLCITSESTRAGRVGFAIDKSIDPEFPADSLRRQLRSPTTKIFRYGPQETAFRFIKNQVRMQMYKRVRDKDV